MIQNHDDFDWLEGDLGFDGDSSDRSIEPAQRDLLTLKLLREVIQAQNLDDLVMQDFAEYVLPNLLKVAIGVTAKGGKFFDELDQQREAEGKDRVRRDHAADQSLNTHLLNGLFPTNLIARRLEKLDTTVKRLVRERERRLLIAGFILHDFEKFKYDRFIRIPQKYKDIQNEDDSKIRKLSLAEHRELVYAICIELGIDYLVSPEHPEAYLEYLDDLLCVAYNAQRRWDKNWNFSTFGLDNLKLKDRVLGCLADLSCLADLLSSIIKHPQDAENRTLFERIHSLSDGQLKFTYHSIAENRGVLTNVVNNALMEAHTSLNTPEHTYYEPLLYLPTGVIYLADRNAPPVEPQGLSNRVVASIKDCVQSNYSLEKLDLVAEMLA